MKKKAPSERGWEILFRFVQERAKRQGPDGDLADDEKAEALEQSAKDARELLKSPGYLRLRLHGLDEIVKDFAEWLSLDPAHRDFAQQLTGIHTRAAPRFWELFWPEQVIHAAAEAARKREEKEEAHGR